MKNFIKIGLIGVVVSFLITISELSLDIVEQKPALQTKTINSFKRSNPCDINSRNNALLAAEVNCTPWNLQENGCYERVCCCDKKGRHWCERCCPDKSGKCVVYKIKC